MANEISVSAILIEQEDGSFVSNCPDLGLSSKGNSSDEALENLKTAIAGHVKEKGAALQLNAVKCVKLKVQV